MSFSGDIKKAIMSIVNQMRSFVRRQTRHLPQIVYLIVFVGSLLAVHNAAQLSPTALIVIVATLAVMAVIGRITSEYAMIKNYGNRIPIPRKRFTEAKGEEVLMNVDRVQELLLYVNELEDWLDDRGLMPEEHTGNNEEQ